MNPDYAKLTMDLGSTEITATATTSLPSFSTFMEGYSSNYELKPSCLYQMQPSGPRPLIKMEEDRAHGYHHHHHEHHHHHHHHQQPAAQQGAQGKPGHAVSHFAERETEALRGQGSA